MPHDSTTALCAGSRLGPYEVLGLLGAGGMGEVYRARDPRLGRDVAVKVLPEPVASDPRRLRFFEREARAAAALNHPNILDVHDIGSHEETHYVVFELLEGATLRDRLRTDGRLPVSRALDVAVQISRGLAAAHEKGIVHRDLKPENLFLTTDGLAKILDFGLARRDDPEAEAQLNSDRKTATQDSRPGSVVGTPGYMSPEQVRGEIADYRSDIFSFGSVLYEMLSGRSAFKRPTAAETQTSILHDDVPELGSAESPVPPALGHLVHRCLEKRREDRFQSTRDVGFALEALSPVPDTSSARRGAPLATSRRLKSILSTNRTRLALLGSAGALLAIAWIVATRLPDPVPSLPQGSTVVLTDIDNRTGDAELESVGALLRHQLQQSAYFDVLDSTQIGDVLNRMVLSPRQRLDAQTARELAWREGIPLIVSASLSRMGSRYLLSIQLETTGEHPESPQRAWTSTFSAQQKDGLFGAVDAASTWIRETVGEATQDLSMRNVPVREATTSSWEALELYSKAETLKEQDRREDAVFLLKDAIEADEHFALALMRLGDLLVSLGRYQEGYAYWAKAQEASALRRLTRREELRITALYAQDIGDFATAERLFRIFSLYYPNDHYPFFHHAFALRALGRHQEAVAKLRTAEEKAPTLYYVPVQLAMTFILLGDVDSAREQGRILRRLEHNQWADFVAGACAFLEGDYGQSESYLSRLASSTDPQWRARGEASWAYVLGELGQYGKTIDILEHGIAADEQNREMLAKQGDKLLALAYLRYRQGDLDACKEACLAAVSTESSPRRLMRAGMLLARAGFNAEAEALHTRLESYQQLPVIERAKKRVLGELLTARGDDREALEVFKQADVLEPAFLPREYMARTLHRVGRDEDALRIYGEIKNSPGQFWLFPGEELPGFWADSILEYARLAHSLKRFGEAREAIQLYLNIRKEADPDLKDVDEAEILLNDLSGEAGPGT